MKKPAQDVDDGCARCGCCDSIWESCWDCGGAGGRDGEDLMDEDPLWYGPDDYEACGTCDGRGGYLMCLGSCDEKGKHAPEPASPPSNPSDS